MNRYQRALIKFLQDETQNVQKLKLELSELLTMRTPWRASTFFFSQSYKSLSYKELYADEQAADMLSVMLSCKRISENEGMQNILIAISQFNRGFTHLAPIYECMLKSCLHNQRKLFGEIFRSIKIMTNANWEGYFFVERAIIDRDYESCRKLVDLIKAKKCCPLRKHLFQWLITFRPLLETEDDRIAFDKLVEPKENISPDGGADIDSSASASAPASGYR